ncbi:MAG: hypothetical protein ABIL05_04290, partial [candidate division WOR-3 bacterium]
MKINPNSNRFFLIILLLILINLLFRPPSLPRGYNLKENDIAPRDIIAPYDFDILKSEDELAQAKKEIALRIPKIFDYDETAFATLKSQFEYLNSFFDTLATINLS